MDEKTMTTKELAEALGVTDRTIRQTVENMGGDFRKSISESPSGGRPTMVFNEAQATAIKLELQEHSKVNSQTPKTKLEVNLLVQQAMLALKQEQLELEAQLLAAKPAIEFYNDVIQSGQTIDMAAVAKLLDKKLGRNKLFEFLRLKGVLDRDNRPYQKYCDAGYFRLVETKFTDPYGNIHIYLKPVVYQKGVAFINKLLNKEGNDAGRNLDTAGSRGLVQA